jgi:hypothetical protein
MKWHLDTDTIKKRLNEMEEARRQLAMKMSSELDMRYIDGCLTNPPMPKPDFMNRDLSLYQSWCIRCIKMLIPTLLTGFDQTYTAACDNCGQETHLAIVKVEKKEPD